MGRKERRHSARHEARSGKQRAQQRQVRAARQRTRRLRGPIAASLFLGLMVTWVYVTQGSKERIWSLEHGHWHELDKSGNVVGETPERDPSAAEPVEGTPDERDEKLAGALVKKARKAQEEGDFETALRDAGAVVRDYPDSKVAGQARRIRDESRLVGKPAPAVGVERWYVDGTLDLEHGATLLLFFEEWCPHCRDEVPALQALHEVQPGKPAVVGLTRITQTSTEDSLKAFLQSAGVTYPVAKVGEEVALAYAVSGIPAAALVVDGSVSWRGNPASLSAERLAALIDSAEPTEAE